MLKGPFCYNCGQHEQHLHEPFWKIFAHTFLDYWHFDAKFIQTIIPLCFKPGFLTNEWRKGKRVRYVHPVQLYFFVSVIFFLLYFSFGAKPALNFNNNDSDSARAAIKKDVNVTIDSIRGKDTSNQIILGNDTIQHLPKSVAAYKDSIAKLPSSARPSWYKQVGEELVINSENNREEFFKEISDNFFHNLPKMMFLLLPFFAILLKLLYIRRKVYFIDHAVFTLHVHSFFFILLLIDAAMINYLGIAGIAAIFSLVYLYFAMKRVYLQGTLKTIVKMFLLLFTYSIGLGIVLVLDIVLSAYEAGT